MPGIELVVPHLPTPDLPVLDYKAIRSFNLDPAVPSFDRAWDKMSDFIWGPRRVQSNPEVPEPAEQEPQSEE